MFVDHAKGKQESIWMWFYVYTMYIMAWNRIIYTENIVSVKFPYLILTGTVDSYLQQVKVFELKFCFYISSTANKDVFRNVWKDSLLASELLGYKKITIKKHIA